MQKNTKSAISMFLAVMMVVSLFAGSIPAMAASTLSPRNMSEIGQVTFDVKKTSAAPILDGTVNSSEYGAPIATLNAGSLGSYYSLESYLTAQDAKKVLPKDWNIYVTYDDEYIYVASAVYDESHNTPKGGVDIWEGDYLGFDISTNISDSFTDMRNRNRFALGMSNDGDVCMYLANKQSNITASPYRDGYIFNDSGTVTRDEVTKITTYEMRIPWDCVSPDGKPVPEAYMLFYLGVGHEGYESMQGYGGYLGAFRYAATVPSDMQGEVGGAMVYHIANFEGVVSPIGTPVTSGLVFNGNGQNASMQSVLGADIPVTMEFVVKMSGSGGIRQILFGGSGNLPMNIELTAANQLRYYENNAPNLVAGVPAIFDGQWHTITFIRDYGAGRIAFYVDGELFQEWNGQTLSNSANTLDGIQYIGADTRQTMTFNGTMSEVRMWNTIRTAEQIKAGVNRNITGSEASLAHLYRFETGALLQNPQVVSDTADTANKIGLNLLGFPLPPVQGPLSGLAFNGVNQCIELNSPLSVAEQPTTFEIVLRTNKHGRQILFGNYNGSGIDVNIEIHANNELRYYENGVPSLMTVPATDALFDGQWHTITFVRDVTGRRGTFYIDGELFQEFTNVTYSNASTAMLLNHRIGADQRAGSLYFGGEISEVRLWSTMRTPEEIKVNANLNLTGSEAGLAHLYQLDESMNGQSSPIVPDKADRAGTINARLIGFNLTEPAYSGLRFNGAGQNAAMQSALGADIPSTVEMIVKMAGSGKRQILFGGNLNMNIELTASNVLRYWENGSPDLYTPAVPAIFDGQWHTITFVREYNSPGQSRIAFYVDGSLFHEWNGLTLSNSSNTLPAIQYIGADSRQTMTFDGAISEVRLWNTVRTLSEIASNVNLNLTGSEAGLTHLYQLNSDLLTEYPAIIRDKVSVNPINVNLIGFVKALEFDVSMPTRLINRGDIADIEVTLTNRTNAEITGFGINITAPYSAVPVSVPSADSLSVPAGGQVTLSYKYRILEGGREAFRAALVMDGEVIDSAAAGVSVAGPGFYRGDNHSHSVHSDGSGTIAQNAAQAFNVQMLSWLNSTDHNTMNHLTDTIIQTSNYGGRFINLASNEYSFSFGHALTLGTNAVFPSSLVRFQGDTAGWQSVIDATNASGGSFYIAHNYEGGIGHSFDYTVPTLMGLRNHAGLEVWNSLNRTAHDPLSRMQFDAWDMMNAQGTGKYAGLTVSDSHSVAKIGDAHIKAFLPSLTTNNINAVLKNGKYIGTNGPEIRFDIEGAGISETLNITGDTKTANFNISAYCPVSNLTSVEIIKNTITGNYELNREVVWSIDLRGTNTNSFDGTIQLDVKPGEFYRVEVNSEKAAAAMSLTGYAYTNNIWIEAAGKSNATDLRDIQYSGNGIELNTLPTGIVYMSGIEGANLDLGKLTATVADGAKLEKSYNETTRILTLKVTAEDGTVSVKEIFVFDPITYVPVGPEIPTIEDAVASAAVIGGNTLMIAVVEFMSDITTNTITEIFTVENNTKSTYTVGAYQVYVALSGNKVTECYIVEETETPVVRIETVEIKQTVVGGSYNFEAYTLPSGYKYEIVSRPNTAGGVATINAWNQFAFNPQAAPTNLSRAGEYTVEVRNADGTLAWIYRFVVTQSATTPPAAVTLSSASNAKFISIKETAKNVWTLTFTADVKYSDGSSKTVQYAVNLSGNNANLDGKHKFDVGHDLAGYTLAYDIKGNGSNIKEFKLAK